MVSWVVRKWPRSGGGWSARKRRRKAGDERTASRKVRQLRAARTRLAREGRRRKISRRRSAPMAAMVVAEMGGLVTRLLAEVIVVALMKIGPRMGVMSQLKTTPKAKRVHLCSIELRGNKTVKRLKAQNHFRCWILSS